MDHVTLDQVRPAEARRENQSPPACVRGGQLTAILSAHGLSFGLDLWL
jgi:hypothetical protein